MEFHMRVIPQQHDSTISLYLKVSCFVFRFFVCLFVFAIVDVKGREEQTNKRLSKLFS